MAATTSRIILNLPNGQKKRLSLYNASEAAVDSFLPVEFSRVANANSSKDWKCPGDCEVYDYIAGPATGVFEVRENGKSMDFDFENAAQQPGSAGRCIPVGLKFKKDGVYQFLVTSAFPA